MKSNLHQIDTGARAPLAAGDAGLRARWMALDTFFPVVLILFTAAFVLAGVVQGIESSANALAAPQTFEARAAGSYAGVSVDAGIGVRARQRNTPMA